jgi:hypothetical protein
VSVKVLRRLIGRTKKAHAGGGLKCQGEPVNGGLGVLSSS